MNIALAEQHSFPLGDVFRFLQADAVQPILGQGGARFSHLRHAGAGTRIARMAHCYDFRGGKESSEHRSNVMRSDDLSDVGVSGRGGVF